MSVCIYIYIYIYLFSFSFSFDGSTNVYCVCVRNRKNIDDIVLQLQNRTYFHLTNYERRETIGEIKDVNACIHIIYLPEEWLTSNGSRSFPQYIDHQMLLVLEGQFLYTRSVEIIVEGKKSLRINGMPKCLNILNQAVKKCGED